MPAFGLEQLPSDVGFQIPGGSGQMFLLEMHYINTTSSTVADSTGLKLCATRTARPHTASLTWLGTEDLDGPAGMPPHATSTFSGICNPARNGLAGADDIHLLMLVPHMHLLGISSHTILYRADGTSETLLDQPYDYASPQVYRMDVLLHDGDTLQTSCVYNNTTDNNVAFGPTLSDEMCYMFALAYPATALDHPGLSLVGAMDTCLW
jgi:Copper type II ascorbate-dependent monooxygenase, C-terminal domain